MLILPITDRGRRLVEQPRRSLTFSNAFTASDTSIVLMTINLGKKSEDSVIAPETVNIPALEWALCSKACKYHSLSRCNLRFPFCLLCLLDSTYRPHPKSRIVVDILPCPGTDPFHQVSQFPIFLPRISCESIPNTDFICSRL